jgi:hypothetical protein
MSTPRTVCLVVLGRHIPQFGLFDTLSGDEPVPVEHARLYQRLLARGFGPRLARGQRDDVAGVTGPCQDAQGARWRTGFPLFSQAAPASGPFSAPC